MKNLGVIIITVFVVFMFAASGLVTYATTYTDSFTVKSKERICESGNKSECKYLIYTDKGVFENTDTIWYLKYNSSDIYGQLDEGELFIAKITGFRVPFLNMYKNIVEVENFWEEEKNYE